MSYPSIKKSFLRNWIAPLIFYSLVWKFLLWIRRKNFLVVNYHGVVKGDYSEINRKHISEIEFRRQLIFLKSNFEVVCLEKFYSSFASPRSKKPIALITFDDGFVNNLEYAVPILEELGLPAVFFVSTIGIVDPNKILWPDFIETLCFLKKNDGISFSGWNFVDIGNKDFYCTALGKDIYRFFKDCNYANRENYLMELDNKYLVSNYIRKKHHEFYRIMNLNEINQLRKAMPIRMQIGSHAHNHYNLGELPDEDLRSELTVSYNLLADIFPANVRALAFPDGSYKDIVVAEAGKVGYNLFFGVNPDTKRYGKNWIIPRYSVSSTTTFEVNALSMVMFLKYGIKKYPSQGT